MARDPESRYADAAALHADLVKLAQGGSTEARHAEGGALRRAWTQLRWFTSGHPYEYKSKTTFLGLPLVHVISGYRVPGQPFRVAKGWFAVGDRAYGGIACGVVAVGGITSGAVSFSLLAGFSGAAVSLGVACGGFALGTLATGGLSLGFLAFGGLAFGYGAVGGFARGRYAMGGNADGTYYIRDDDDHNVTTEEWWDGVFAWTANL